MYKYGDRVSIGPNPYYAPEGRATVLGVPNIPIEDLRENCVVVHPDSDPEPLPAEGYGLSFGESFIVELDDITPRED